MKTQTGIVHIATKETSKKKIVVEIRLDDECHNGHCDFAITGETYIKESGRWIHNEGGCIHDTILKYFPEFKDFVTLHLSDCHGVPMYAVENGIYWLKEGGAEKAAEYLHISKAEAMQLSADKRYFKYQLFKMGIVDRWQKAADAAIKHLEELSGDTFVNPYKPEEERTLTLTDEECQEVETLLAQGYWEKEAIAEREEKARIEKLEKERDRIVSRYDKVMQDAVLDKAVSLYIFDRLGTVDNIIYYTHKNTVVFNYTEERFAHYCKHWTREEFQAFVDSVSEDDHSDWDDEVFLPEGIKFEFQYDYAK